MDQSVREPESIEHVGAPTGPDDTSGTIPVVTKAKKGARLSQRSKILLYVLAGVFVLLFAYGFGVFGSTPKNNTAATPPLNTASRTGDTGDAAGTSTLDSMTANAPRALPPINVDKDTKGGSIDQQRDKTNPNGKDSLSVALNAGAAGGAGATPDPTATFDVSGPSAPPVDGTNNNGSVPNPGGAAPPPEVAQQQPTAAAAAPVADAQAAHKSPIFIGNDNAGQAAPAAAASPGTDSTTQRAADSPPVDQSGGFVAPQPAATSGGATGPDAASVNARIAFANGQGQRPAYLAAVVTEPIGKYELWRGSIIPALLDSGINSSAPGPVIAHVTSDVFDSKTGQTLVIPKGSRLHGRNNSIVSDGVPRMQVAWDYLTWPNGKWINLDAMPGTEPDGNGGLIADVNDHRGAIIGASLFTAILSAGANVLASGGGAAGGTTVVSNGQVVTQSVGTQLAQTGQTFIDKKMEIPPELTVPKGKPFDVTLDRTVVLPAYAY